MTIHKSEDYKLTAVQYYLVEDKTQEEVCKVFKCTPRSLNIYKNSKMKSIYIYKN
jgi:hypothetical protein